MINRIHTALQGAGIDVRLPTRHIGACTAPYCVLYEGAPFADQVGKSVAVRHALIDILVPASTPAALWREAAKIRAVLRGIGCSAGTLGQTAVPEDYKAVTATLDVPVLCG